jgi:hypothetical protein
MGQVNRSVEDAGAFLSVLAGNRRRSRLAGTAHNEVKDRIMAKVFITGSSDGLARIANENLAAFHSEDGPSGSLRSEIPQ